MMWLKLAGGAIVVAIAGYLLWAVADRQHLAKVVALDKKCFAAAASPSADLAACAPALAAQIGQARGAALCEDALAKRNLFAIRAVCSEQVKRVVADRDAAGDNYADARVQLDAAQRRQDDAVARAEARALSTAQRKTANDRIIQAAPRDPDGRARCDAQCLRALAQP